MVSSQQVRFCYSMRVGVGEWVARVSESGNVMPSMYQLRHQYPVRVMFVGWPGVHVKDYAEQREVGDLTLFYGFSIRNDILVRSANCSWIMTAYLFFSLKIYTTTSSTSAIGAHPFRVLRYPTCLTGFSGPSSTVSSCPSFTMIIHVPLTYSNGQPTKQ